MTYYNEEALYDDVPILEDERNKGKVQRYGSEADSEIDQELEPFTTVPLTGTIPIPIQTAANLRIKWKYFFDQGEIDKADSALNAAMKLVKEYIKTITQNNPESPTTVVVSSAYQMISE